MELRKAITEPARLLAMAAFAGTFGIGAASAQSLHTNSAGAEMGVYDPHAAYSDDSNIGIESIYLPWEDVDLASLSNAKNYAQERGRKLVVTIEPWSWSREPRISRDELRSGILEGRYDANMARICALIGSFDEPVVVRWAHEMEDTTSPYPWANWAPEDYITAYRRMVDICRAEAPDSRFMWSPLGHEGLQAYYPGDDYVDSIGLSVFGLQDYDNDNFGSDRSIADVLTPKYDLVAGYGKPISVAELGSDGSAEYVANWTEEMLNPPEGFPEVSSIVYYNAREVFAWPDPYGYPDWRLK